MVKRAVLLREMMVKVGGWLVLRRQGHHGQGLPGGRSSCHSQGREGSTLLQGVAHSRLRLLSGAVSPSVDVRSGPLAPDPLHTLQPPHVLTLLLLSELQLQTFYLTSQVSTLLLLALRQLFSNGHNSHSPMCMCSTAWRKIRGYVITNSSYVTA